MNNPIVARELFVRQAAQELTEHYPDLWWRLNRRIERAIDLAATRRVFDQGVIDLTPTFSVQSQTNQTCYTVQGRGETWQICSCPDNQRGNRCKHGLAVVFALRAVELEKQFRAEGEVAFPADAPSEEMAA